MMRLRVAGNVEVVAADPDDHVILDHDRGGRGVVEVVHVADLLPPALLPILEIQRDEVAVGRLEIQPVLVYRNAAVPEVVSACRRPLVVPELAPGTRVHGPDVIRDREVEDAVDLQRRALDGAKSRTGRGDAEHPRQTQLVNVGVVDRRERAEAASRIIAVEGRPAVGARFEKLRRVQPALSGQPDGRRQDTRKEDGEKLEAPAVACRAMAGATRFGEASPKRAESWRAEAREACSWLASRSSFADRAARLRQGWKLEAGSGKLHFSVSRYATTSCIALSVSLSSSSTCAA